MNNSALQADARSVPRHRGDWDRLASLVREFDADVVVLVARKMPRVVEALGLRLSTHGHVVSDLALPFMSPWLKGARVAIVDDTINVGTTVEFAAQQARAGGAAVVRAFALSRRQRPPDIRNVEVTYADSPPELSTPEADLIAQEIPRLIQQLPKPYDLAFPAIPCVLVAPFQEFPDFADELRAVHGKQSVYDVTTIMGARHGVRRLVVNFGTAGATYRKIRIYIDSARRRCTIVPIVITHPLPIAEPHAKSNAWSHVVFSTLMRRLSAESAGPQLWPHEAACRLRLFVDSLDFGLQAIADWRYLLQSAEPIPFSLPDAELLLGPAVREIENVRLPSNAPTLVEPASERRPLTSALGNKTTFEASPFYDHVCKPWVDEFESCITRDDELPPVRTILNAFFEFLGESVGASDAMRYRLQWPYTTDQIKLEPYLRLRVGPTVDDLTKLCFYARGGCDPVSYLRAELAQQLDRLIDNGVVVPTIARYDDEMFRIFRKGEARDRDDLSEMMRFAWSTIPNGLSLTRASKIFATLAHSGRSLPGVGLRADERGTVACYDTSILSEPTEVTHFLLRTGALSKKRDSIESE